MKARSIPYILATVCHFVYKPSSAFHVHRLAVMTSLKQSGAFAVASWSPDDASDVKQVKEDLKVWPLDEYNVKLLNEVHPKSWEASGEKDEDGYYDFIAIGAGAGGLVSSRQVCAERLLISILLWSQITSDHNIHRLQEGGRNLP